MEVCNLMVEKPPFGVCNDCYTSVVFGYPVPLLPLNDKNDLLFVSVLCTYIVN